MRSIFLTILVLFLCGCHTTKKVTEETAEYKEQASAYIENDSTTEESSTEVVWTDSNYCVTLDEVEVYGSAIKFSAPDSSGNQYVTEVINLNISKNKREQKQKSGSLELNSQKEKNTSSSMSQASEEMHDKKNTVEKKTKFTDVWWKFLGIVLLALLLAKALYKFIKAIRG